MQTNVIILIFIVVVLLVLWLVGFNFCVGLDNTQTKLFKAIKAENKDDYLRAIKDLDLDDDDDIEDFLQSFLRWPMRFFVGGDPWEKLQEKRVELGISTNNSSTK